MFVRTKNGVYFTTMYTGLSVLGVLTALKIDGQLAVIKNDCYERLAIGQRHNPKDIYKTSHVTTVFECQLFCTEEKELCKSFSFGIGVKGNASCELSTDPIKETADLKPIGTKADTDYDLYIKKLGCTLVIDKNNPAFDHYKPQNKPSNSYDKPQNNVESGYGTNSDDKPQSSQGNGEGYGTNVKPENNLGNGYSYDKPQTSQDSGYGSNTYNKPQSSGGYRPPSAIYNTPQINKPLDSGYGSRPTYSRPQDDVHHVQTLVSVSTGPQKLHPYHEILIGDEAYNYARPPFRPSTLNHPYDKPPRPLRPDDSRPDYDRPNAGYPDSRPGESNLVAYGHRPIPDRYASYIPRPDLYNDYRPRPDDRYPPTDGRPSGYYKPRPPVDEYIPKPRPPINEYIPRPRPPPDDYNTRPTRPNNDYNNRPNLGGDYDRPVRPAISYNERPSDYDRPNQRPRPPSSDYDRPNRPSSDYQRPTPPSSDYGRPSRPSGDYQRPKPPSDDYDRPTNPASNQYDRPKPPSDYDRPTNRPNSQYDRPKPSSDYDRPNLPSNQYDRPKPPSDYDRPTNRPSSQYDRPKPPSDYDRPSGHYDRPVNSLSSHYDRPNPPLTDYHHKPNRPGSGYEDRLIYDQNRPSKPSNEYLFGDIDRYDTQSQKPSRPSEGYQKPSESSKSPTTSGYDNSIQGTSKPKDPHSKPIITQSVGPHGESITSIITELEGACFRRVLAGKRVTRALVRRALFCERVEDCQHECAEEKRFVCEGFNYRLDPTGRGKGECELLDIPLSHLDIGRDLYPHPDYDYYERDRNAASANCRRQGYYPGYDGGYNRRHDQRPPNWYDDRNSYGNRRPRPDYGYDRRPNYGDDGYRRNDNRRGDFAYHDSHHSDHSHNYHYEHYDHGPPPYDYKSYEPYLPPRRPTYTEDRYYYHMDADRDKNYWGTDRPAWGSYGGSYGTNSNPYDFERKNYYLPPPPEGNKYWGQYGGSYGNGGLNLQYSGYGHSQSFDFWGLNKYEEKFHNYGELPPPKKPLNGGNYLPDLPPSGGGSYLPELQPKPPSGGSYLPESTLKPPFLGGGGSYLPVRPPVNTGSYLPVPGTPTQDDIHNNAIFPAEPRYPYNYDFLKDVCSLRMAAGFRLRKAIVKKFYSVSDLFECELLCFKEKEFPCASYAYKYTSSLKGPRENCYLSTLNYKELDFYTDLEPDRDFDVYTMNNMKKCEQPVYREKHYSECAWRVRSAQRLDHKVVRDSLSVASEIDCLRECLRTVRFTCRAFSFRYGPPVIGGPIDNCLLTDWPYYEMDPHIHFVPEPGFEIYERGSFGHGCEPNHFGIGGKPFKNPGSKIDQLCYAGLKTPARLLRQATRKELQVATEEECKVECSKFREKTLFQCMSLSYSNNAPKWEPNCKLSDILQRDLLPNVDYIHDPDSWLFAWDNYNPQCRAVAHEPVHNNIGHKENRYDYDISNPVGTWRVYSVSGWPCRRGTSCRENRVGGFWYCELEGGDSSAWDYCCRPDHQCGFSEGFPYQWCYVGPARTQWRKCSDRYYPYIHNVIDRFDRPPSRPGGGNYLPDHRPPPPGGGNYLPDHRPPPPGGGNYLPDHRPPPYRPGVRPDRPPAPPTPPPPRPSLDEYEMQFATQFLDPPKPGGFGQPRHWPLLYLHKEMPPNSTDSDSRLMKAVKGSNPKYAAIQNLIDIIKSNDLQNVQYQITNESNKADDILFVKIPLPTNFTQESKKSEKIVANSTQVVSQPVDLNVESKNNTKRSQKSLPVEDRVVPVYRRGYITRANITNHRNRSSKTL